MGPINLMGPEPMPQEVVPSLTGEDLLAMASQVRIVDARPRERFAAAHIPGSIGIEMADDFGVWTGWLVPFGTPLALVLDEDQDLAEALVQLARIGFDDVRGVLWGLLSWDATAHPLASYDMVDLAQAVDAIQRSRVPQLLDVRSPAEWQDGHVETAVHGYVPDLANGAPSELSREQPVWVMCRSGYRASIAAGLLERDGFQPIVLSRGGVPDVMQLLPAVRAA
jgi:rhodanese-related sulfurtransferase